MTLSDPARARRAFFDYLFGRVARQPDPPGTRRARVIDLAAPHPSERRRHLAGRSPDEPAPLAPTPPVTSTPTRRQG